MTYGACTPQDFARFDRDASRSRRPDTLTILCAATLAVSASVGLWALYAPAYQQPGPEAAPVIGHDISLASAPAAIAPLRHHAALLDPAFSSGAAPLTFAQSAPLRSHFEPQRREATGPLASAPTVVTPRIAGLRTGDPQTETAQQSMPAPTQTASLEPQTVPSDPAPADPAMSEIVADVPLPAPRPRFDTPEKDATPAVLAAPRRPAAGATATPPSPAAPGAPGFFEKLFGKPQTQPSGNTALAYAAPQDSVIGNIFSGRPAATPSSDATTAVYDISAHTVYMPDGTQLEAHSGLGDAFDNPNGVHLRMRGATPPNVYDLSQRETLFHGVRALRLTPTGGTTYGRGGLLAHTYMLRGGTGESNGCVVFKNYAAFLRAYDNGQIKRLAVVARRT